MIIFLMAAAVAGTAGQGVLSLDTDYRPRITYTLNSVELQLYIAGCLNPDQFDLNGTSNAEVARQIIHKQRDYLLEVVNEGYVVRDSSMESLLNVVVGNLVQANTWMSDHERRILIFNSPLVNAACYAPGLFAITTRLLALTTTEDQLAFILAHELAHDEAGHIREKIVESAETNISQMTRLQIEKILTGKIDLNEIVEFRNLMYSLGRYNRERELEADSTALAIVARAGYDAEKAASGISLLKDSYAPKYPIKADLFMPFDTEAYPFIVDWLNERPGIFSREWGDFRGTRDSLQSHPDTEARLDALAKASFTSVNPARYQDQKQVTRLAEISEFESVRGAYKQNQYDVCLYYAMQLLDRYPYNEYVSSMIGRVLVDLLKARNDHTFNAYVSIYTVGYSEELRWMNNFLHNIHTDELGEVAYHFINNKLYYNPDDPRHWHLLWEIADLTYRRDLKESAKREYKKQFGKSVSSFRFDEDH